MQILIFTMLEVKTEEKYIVFINALKISIHLNEFK